ncbi:hypothetical protein N7456_007373 [Penicillium angulare]|uniref:Uncharacterized protein n=1 Tax=Penicillium angulare TaxID=116970 RepID=A0A9W9FB06_9EURO|nr:hypothetical protein N7456_007373 [Penicillium angulare]
MDEPDDIPDELPMKERLAVARYNAQDCENAIHGSRIPNTLGELVHRLCTIHGIRHHYGFAQELRGLTPEFTRALNARDIMSGIIPNISQPEEIPYCIWYPDIPKEETLRALVQRYPDMLYHAARVCGIAGYVELYNELDPLPEVHVAEEAGYASMQKDNGGSRQIYQHILSQPLKFEIMNDYTCTVNISGRRVASLNQDTAVFSSLTYRSKYHGPRELRQKARPWDIYGERLPFYFNITEDWAIDDHDCKAPLAPEDYVPLVYSPLPADLPLINKDKLIKLAAYNGEIDRYARLRRPQMIDDEWAFVVHGIYHNPIFAKYWTTQVAELPEDKYDINIRCAINARRIMSDDLTWLTVDTPGKLLPDLIWYPQLAHCLTYRRLAHMRPEMFGSCLRACIVANDSLSWTYLLDASHEIFKSTDGCNDPGDSKLWWLAKHADYGLWCEASKSSNNHFQEDISIAIPDAAAKFSTYHPNSDYWSDFYVANDLYFPFRHRLVRLYDPVQPSANDQGPYDQMNCSVGDVDLALFLRDTISRETWKKEVESEGDLQAPLEDIWRVLDLIQATG